MMMMVVVVVMVMTTTTATSTMVLRRSDHNAVCGQHSFPFNKPKSVVTDV
jgi:hypothetical protein